MPARMSPFSLGFGGSPRPDCQLPNGKRESRQAPSGTHETLHPAWSHHIGSYWPPFRVSVLFCHFDYIPSKELLLYVTLHSTEPIKDQSSFIFGGKVPAQIVLDLRSTV